VTSRKMGRRSFVGACLGVGTYVLAGCSAKSPESTEASAASDQGRQTLDLKQSADFLTAIIKMRGSTAPKLSMGFVIGSYYGIVDDQATPLFGVLAGTFSFYEQIDAATYRARALEVAYFTDIDTGELLETWDNPYTGETVSVPQTRMGPSTTLVTANGLEVKRASGEAVNMQLNHRFRPAVTVGDQVWVTEEIKAVAAISGRQPFVYNEMSTYHSNRGDLEDPNQASVRSNVEFHSIISWRPWMKMGGRPGHLTGRASGRHVKAYDELPTLYKTLNQQHHPDVVEDALGLLKAGET
jgi:hypothetical protein